MPDGVSGERYEAKAAAYSGFGNGRLLTATLAALPTGGSLLDVGCASGGLLRACGDLAGYRAGIEISPSAARNAEQHADAVYVGGAEDLSVLVPADGFDVVVLGDVLEHLADPGRVLARAASWCRVGGTIVASTPNIAYWQARLRLARGVWRYEPTGIFDETHLRFFTRTSLAELFVNAGLNDVGVTGIVPALRNSVPPLERRHRVEAALEPAWQWVGRRRPELMAFQLLAVGRRRAATPPPRPQPECPDPTR